MIEYLRGKSIKWKIILPAVVFVAGIVTVYEIEVCNDRIYQEQKRMKTELNAVNYAQQMMSEMQEGAGITEHPASTGRCCDIYLSGRRQ